MTRRLGLVGIVVAMLGPAFLLGISGDAMASPSATIERTIGSNRSCGETLTVGLLLDWGDAEVLAIEEEYPEGWRVKNASHGGEKTNESTIKWFILDREIKRLSYKVQIPSGNTGNASFFGAYRDDTMSSDEKNGVVKGTTDIDTSCIPSDAGSVTRTLPSSATCGDTIDVSLQVEAPDGNDAWILDENPPLQATDIDQEDHGESRNGHVKWVATDGGSGVRTYAVQIPSDALNGTTYIFRGEYRFHPSMGSRASIGGDTVVRIQCDEPLTTTSSDDGDTTSQTPSLPPPDREVTGQALDTKPENAVGAYTADLDTGEGESVSVQLSDAIIPTIDVYPSQPLDGASLEATVWPAQDAPGDTPTMLRGVQPAYVLDVHLKGASSTTGHTIVLHVQLPADKVPGQPDQGILLHAEDGAWTGVGSLGLQPTQDDGYEGKVQTPCCSLFALGFDIVDPTVSLTVTTSADGPVSLAADASDNVGLDHVTFLVDGEMAHRDTTAPYQAELDPAGFSPSDHTVEAVAVDLTGAESTATRSATFGTADPGLGLLGWIGIFALAGTVCAAGYAATRRDDLTDLTQGAFPWFSDREDPDPSPPAPEPSQSIDEAAVEELDPADMDPLQEGDAGVGGEQASGAEEAAPEDPETQKVLDLFLGVQGIGPSKARALHDAGFRSLEDLRDADPDALTAAEGIGPKLAASIQENLLEGDQGIEPGTEGPPSDGLSPSDGEPGAQTEEPDRQPPRPPEASGSNDIGDGR